MPTALTVPGTQRAHQYNRQRALEAVQNENTALTRFLFDTFTTDEKSRKTSREALSLLEKQDRNLEGQLAEVKQYVLDRRAALEAAKLAFQQHLETHGRANGGHQETLSSINRLASLEDKKHVSLVSRGQAEHASLTVKEKINVTRRERLLFESMSKKYRKELGRIGSEVLCMVTECTERLERTKRSRACVERLKEVARQEEEAWASGWRAQILRMDAFTEREGRIQRARVEEKRARTLALLGGRGALGGKAEEKSKGGGKKQENLKELAGVAMARVAAHVLDGDWEGSRDELHLAIVRAFDEARATGMAKALSNMSGEKGTEDDHIVKMVDDDGDMEDTQCIVGTRATTAALKDAPTRGLDFYQSLIHRLCEAAGISTAGVAAAGNEAELLTLLAMVELFVLVSCKP